MLNSNSNNSPFFQSVFEVLEDRILFDGVPDATFVMPEADIAQPAPAQTQSQQSSEFQLPTELIIIDSGVEDVESLLSGILESKPDSALEIRILDVNSDGIQQITDILAASEGQYDAIHILSHGDEGQVNLGNSTLTAENASEYADQLAVWADALTEDADLLFYGCELAGDESGLELIEYVSAATGADVAASDDLTGAAELGGDWELEEHVGTIETEALVARDFAQVLMDTDGDGVDDSDDIDDDNDGILDAEEGLSFENRSFTLNTAASTSGGPGVGELVFEDADGNRIIMSLGGTGTASSVDATNGSMSYTNSPTDEPEVLITGLLADGVTPMDISSLNLSGLRDLDAAESRDSFAFDVPGTFSNLSGLAVYQVDPTAPQNGTLVSGNPASAAVDFQPFVDAGATSEAILNTDTGVDQFNGGPGFDVIFTPDVPTDSLTLFIRDVEGTTFIIGGFMSTELSGLVNVPADTDTDGIGNLVDLDSDNDGISDLFESGTSAAIIAADTNSDGTISVAEAEAVLGAGNADADGDGLLDIFDADTTDASETASVGTVPVDSDTDGSTDFVDLDSDDDGIADTIEARPTAGYVANDGDVTDNDADGDGVIDIFDANDGTTGDFGATHANFNAPEDTDGDGTPDHLDQNSDNDGLNDASESGLAAVSDATFTDPDGSVNTTLADLENATDSDPSDVDFRSLNDKDGDGVADVDDLDDDNDGILDINEHEPYAPVFFDMPGQTFDTTEVHGDFIVDYEFSTFGTPGPTLGFPVVQTNEGFTAAEIPDNSIETGGGSETASNVRITSTMGPVNSITIRVVGIDPGNSEFVRFFGTDTDNTGATLSFSITAPDGQSGLVFDAANNQYIPTMSGSGGEITISSTIPFNSLALSSFGPYNVLSSVITADFATLGNGIEIDTDGDGVNDHCDLDSDNDGISDLYESGASAAVIAADTNGDGTISVAEAEAVLGAGNADADGDGLLDIFDADTADASETASVGTVPADSDGDGSADFVDLDSDDDGIADTIEARPTVGYVANDGDVTDNDADGDGVIDIFDANDGTTGDFGATHANFNAPEDTDGDGTPDYLDQNSDNDGLNDASESGLAAVSDATFTDPDGSVNTTLADLENATDSDPSDVDFRSLNDKDGDGVADVDDLDDDNDGILDVDESAGFQTVDLPTLASGQGAVGSLDPNWTVEFVDNPGDIAFAPGVAGTQQATVIGNLAPGAWVNPPAGTDWISYDFSDIAAANSPGDHSDADGDGIEAEGSPIAPITGLGDSVRLEFSNTVTVPAGAIPGTISLDLTVAADNDIIDVLVNGVSNGVATSGFNQLSDITLDQGWQAGDNVITVVVDSGPRLAGFLTTDGSLTFALAADTDGDGVNDHCDLDSDNDGVSDLVESGNQTLISADTDGDGVVSGAEAAAAGLVDADGDGVWDGTEQAPVDSDNDGVADFLDLDSDDDGIPDVVENQPTAGYVAPTGVDSDGDGIDDAFDLTIGLGGDFVTPENTDGDNTPDFLDDDSDNDGVDDIVESGLTLTGTDADMDGIDDGVNASFSDPDGDVNVPSNDLSNEAGDTSEVGFREVSADLVTVKTLASGDSTPDEGDTVTFEIVVTNNGGADATNVSLVDQLPAGLTYLSDTAAGGSYNPTTGLWTIGTLADGASATITISATVDVGQGGNAITNVATAATSDQGDPTTAGDDLNETVTVNDAADLVTVKSLSSGDATPAEGDTVTFEIEVTNNGGAQATNVTLTDALPSGLTYASDTAVGGAYDPATGLWTIGTLNVGETATLSISATVDAGQGGNTITNIATAATGDQTDPTMAGDDLQEAVVAVAPATDLVTEKTLASGDATPDEGDVVTYEISVTNNGPDAATGVSLTDLLPAGLTPTANNGTGVIGGNYDPVTGLWTIGNLASGATVTLTLEGTVDVGQGGNTITNVTTAATGDQVDPSMAGDDLEESVVVNDAADLVTVKTLASGDATPAEGDTVTFEIEVTNNGGAQATNVALTDALPSGLTYTSDTAVGGAYDPATGVWTVGTLNVGETATLSISATVDAGQGGNTITNVTTAATGDQTDPTMAGDDLDESVVVEDNTTDLVTVKTLASGDSTPDEGDTVVFQIDVTNNGGAQATNVSLTDNLPAGFTLTSNSVTQGTYAAGLWTIGTLDVGSTATITLTGTIDAGQGGNTITNVATAATGDQTDPTMAGDDLQEAVVVGVPAADLVTEKTLASGDATPDEGDVVTYEISVTNNGPDAATGVSLTDLLPAGLTPTANNGTGVIGGNYDPVTGLWTIGNLASGATVTLTLEGTVDVGQGGNTITNVTTAATGDQVDPTTDGDDLQEAIVVNDAADLVTVKTLASGDATPAEGDTVTFEITVTNNGGAQATNVALTDALPSGLTYTSDTAIGGAYDPATGVWTVGTLNVGETATLSISATVDAGQGGNTITNVTTAATGDQTDPTMAGDDLDESVVVEDNTTDLVTVKTLAGGNTTPEEGDTVTFDITVTNDGPITATNVSLTDLLPVGITYTSSSVTQGSYDSATGLFDIGTLANGATATLTLEGTVDAGESGNTITNVTTAAVGDQDDPSTAGDDLDESVIVGVPAADLVTVKTLASGDATPDEGDTVTFEISVTNNGPDTATNVSLIDQLPAGLTYVSDTSAGGVYDPATGLWTIGDLASGATATIEISATVNVGEGGNTITNITTAATGDQPDPSTAGNDLEEAVVINDAADLVTVKTLASGDSTPAEGDIVTYEITVTNNGGAQATNVSLTDLLPPGLTPTAINGSSDVAAQPAYAVEVTNGTFTDFFATPVWFGLHDGTFDLFDSGSAASNPLEIIAELGDASALIADFEAAPGSPGDINGLVFGGATGVAPISPGETGIGGFNIINPAAYQYFSFASMVVPSNDTFIGNGNPLEHQIFDAAGNFLGTNGVFEIPITRIYDAGTEVNDASANGGAAFIAGVDEFQGADENGVVTLETDLSEFQGAMTPNGFTINDTTLNAGEAFATIRIVEIPGGAAYDAETGLWSIGTLDVGETVTLTIQGTVDAGQGGNTITNIATAATGDQTDPTMAGDDLDESVVVEDNTTDLVTVKTLASGDSTPDEGDTIVFQIDVTNNGGAQATNVSLTDTLPAGFTLTSNSVTQGTYAAGLWTIGTLDVGLTATITLTGTIDAGQSGNTITNVVTAAAGDQTDPTTVGDDLEEAVVVGVPAADLVTVKTLASGDATPDEGDIVTFDITVTNNGPDAATNVSLTDQLPAGLTYVSDTSAGGSYDPATGLWTIGTLASGATVTLILEGTVDVGQGGNTITNVTTAATGDQVDPTTDGDDLQEAIVVNDAADLVTVKTLASGDATPAEGETVVFQIEVTNNGGAQATNVTLTDSIPQGFTLAGNTTTQGTYTGGLWTIGTLNVGETATLTLTGTVDAGQGGNTITNVVTAASGDQVDPSTAGDDLDASVVVDNTTDLVTVKSLASGDSTPDEGDTVVFQIDVTNNGPITATNVSLTDSIPAGFTLAGNTTTQGTYAGGLWTIGNLSVGETATLTLTGTVDAGQAGNIITNVVTAATGDQNDPSTAGDDLDEAVVVNAPVALVADIGVAKAASDAVANGDFFDVTFVLLVENTGTATLNDITLSDNVAAQFGNAYVAASNLAVTNFVGTGTAPTANAAWLSDQSQSLLTGGSLDVGDYVEVSFVITVDPDGIDGVSQSLVNEAIATGSGVNADGAPLLDALGNLQVASDVSDNGADATSDNGTGTADDPTPVVIADLGIAKSVVGQPTFLPSGNSVVTFEVVIANTGSVDLSTLSLQEDIASQFATAFQAASNLTLVTAPTHPNSAIALESTFNGASVTELLDQSTNNYLAVGDSFTIRFDTEVNPDNVTGTLTNQVTGTGFAVDANGDFIHDASGARILASDLSDGGASTSNSNPGDISDTGTADDPTIIDFGQVQGTVDGTSGSPANLRGVPIVGFAPISQLIGGFLGAPGPIYSGIPIASNANPLTLQSARPVTGGYATQFAVPTDMGNLGDCGCAEMGSEFVQSVDPTVEIPYMEQPMMDQPVDDCGVCEVPMEQPMFVDDATVVTECPTCQDVAPCESCNDCGNCCGCGGAQVRPGGVLFRLKNWLHR